MTWVAHAHISSTGNKGLAPVKLRKDYELLP